MSELFPQDPLSRRFHVHLTVRVAASGMFVGRITDEPLPMAEAISVKDAYAENILNGVSLTLPAIGQGDNATLVFPLDVLRRSVLLFWLEEVVAPTKCELDFGSAKATRAWGKNKEV